METTLQLPSAQAPTSRTRQEARMLMLMEGPIFRTLLRLAAPNVLNLIAISILVTADGIFVGWLGAEALAGVTLVFPWKMLMQHMANSGTGGAVAAAIARALGARQPEKVRNLAVHGLIVAAGLALVFTLGGLLFAPTVLAWMGAEGRVLTLALEFSNVLFACAFAPWLFNMLASTLRGTGRMGIPSAAILGAVLLDVILSPLFMFGWGPIPAMGISGAAVGYAAAFTLATLALVPIVQMRDCPVRLSWRGMLPQAPLYWEILKVGLPASLNTVLTNLTVVVVAGLAAALGPAALSGYGVAVRVEYVLIPLAFGFGTAIVTFVGANVGAGQVQRARQIAWTGAATVAALTGTIGLLVAAQPGLWLSWFTTDPASLEVGWMYLRVVGLSYGFYGCGLALFFASQGAGHAIWPFAAIALRMLLIAGAGWWVVHGLGGGTSALFSLIAAAFVVFGLFVAVSVRRAAW